MISDALLSVVFALVNGILDMLPEIEFTLDASVFSGVLKFLQIIVWVLPCGTILSVLGIQIAIGVFRILISVIKTVWDLIPFV